MTSEADSDSASFAAATMTGMLAASELRRGDVLAGRFRIDSVLGIGGMGVVYRARDLSLDVDVAIKVLRPELARRPEAFERFRQELLLARQVSSPHVVRIHDIAQHEGRWFISMDFVDGESLEHRLDRLGKLPMDEALAITHGLLDGLAAAYQRGVVHRDLKPANILLDASSRAYITDFGVARSLGATGVTQSGVILGTPEYLSPEQARGETVDARSDLYAVGLIVYEMMSGKLPFSGGTPAETVMQRIVRQPPSLRLAQPGLPLWLNAFSDRLLKINPAHRFATPREALRALETRKVARAPINRRALLSAMLALVAVLGAASWLYRHPIALSATAPATVTATPRVAVLPFGAPRDDADLAALARGVEEHVLEWLRADASLAVVPRRRMLDALARVAPDADADASRRQLPDIARAAGATRVVTGELRKTDDGLTLALSLVEPGAATTPTLTLRGADAAALFAAYENALPAWLATGAIKIADAPPLPAEDAVPFGRALLALDRKKFDDAATTLAALTPTNRPSALLVGATLDAQEGANQSLPAQTTRDAAIAQFAADTTPRGRALYAHALVGAERAADAVRALASATTAFPNDVSLALSQAETLAANGAGAQALARLEQLVKLDGQDARAWFLLGRTSIQQEQAQSAVDDYLLHALVLDTRAGDRAAEAETRNALGVGYERLGQLDAAAEQYTRAASMRETLGDEEGLAKSLRNLAIVQAVRGDRAAADRTLDRVKGLLEKIGDRASLADLYNDRGVVAEEHGDFAQALSAYREALALRQQLGATAAIAESFNNIGFCSYHLGDFDNALVYWQQALTNYRSIDKRDGELHIEQSIALLDIARGHFVAARERLQASLRNAEDHQLPEETAVAHSYLAELALVEGRYAEADASADRAAQVFARRSDRRGEAESRLTKGRVALALGDVAALDAAIASIAEDELNAEQHAAFLLLSAGRAGLAGDRAGEAAKLLAASQAADEAHSNALAIRVSMEQARAALVGADRTAATRELAELRGKLTHLGEVPLRLAWLELEMANAIRAKTPQDAAARYRESLPLLKQADRYAYASVLHRFGERALGRGAEASAAHAAAQATQAQLLADAPPAARESLARQLALRERQESGEADGP